MDRTLRRWRLLLGGVLVLLAAWLLGPWRPGTLPGDPSLIPRPGQSHVHTVLVATWWAAAANALLCALLLASSGFWARASAEARPARRAPLGRGAWLLLAAAAALAGVLRWPLAHGSVWWDEAWSVRHTIVGKLEPDPGAPGGLAFDPASWRETLWYYHAPTNHAAYSVAARLTTSAWRRLAGAEPYAFDEFALRLPAFGAALAAVLWLGALVAELGFPRAAPAAAFLLAIHPWHVRYGADGRGYAFVVLLGVAGAWLLLRALRDPRWRWWLAYGASQLVLLWTFPLAIYVPAAFAVAGAFALARAPDRTRAQRALQLARFAVANLLAAMAFLQLMGPNLAQAAAFQKEWSDLGRVDLPWIRQLWVYLASGLAAKAPALPDVSYPTLATLAEPRPWLRWVVYGLLPALAGLGLVRALRRGAGAERAVWAGLAAALPLFVLHRALQPFFVLPRFAVFGLVALVPLLAVGLEGVLEALAAPLPRARRALVAGGLVLGVAGFAALVAPELRVLATRPATPSRELVALLAERGGGAPGGALRAGLGLGGDVPRVYDPGIVEVSGPDELAALCRRARDEERALFVFYSYGPINERRLPALFTPVSDPRLFEPVARLDGIESELVIRVLRYTGRPLEDD